MASTSPPSAPDGSDRADAVESIAASRRWLFSSSRTAMAVMGPDGVVVEVNEALCRLLRRPPEAFVGHHLVDISDPDDRDLVQGWLTRCAAGEVHPISVETVFGQESDRPRWFTTEGHPVLSADGELEALVLTIDESTATRLLHGALVTAQTDRAALVTHAPIAVIEVGDGDVVTTWNPSAEALFGRPHREAVGRTLAEVGFAHSPSLRTRALADRHLAAERISATRADGATVELKVWTTTVEGTAGTEPEVVMLLVDVSADVEVDQALRAAERRWRTLIENVSETVTVVDSDGTVLSSTGEVSNVLGYPTETWVGRSVQDLMHPDDLARLQPVIEHCVATPGVSVQAETRVRHSDGSWQDLWVTAVNLIDDPSVGGVVLTTRNVTQHKRAEALVTGQADILELIARGTPLDEVLEAIAVMVEAHDPGAMATVVLVDGERLWPRARAGHGPGPVVSAALGEVQLTQEMHEAFSLGHGVAFVRHRADHPPEDVMLPALEEAGIETAWWAPVVPAAGGLAVAAVCAFHTQHHEPDEHARRAVDTACTLVAIALDRHTTESELAHRDLHDALTGLPNRTLLLDRMHIGLDRVHRIGAELGVVYVDLDRFKLVNDTYGLVAGDRILTAVADRLRTATRPGDTIARVGADEFVVVCDRPGQLATILSIAERITDALRDPFPLDDGDVVLTASLGLALSTPGVDAATLIRQADSAMFRAKQRGRNRVEMFDPAMQASAHDRLSLASDLRRAIDRDELSVAYQPIVALDSGRIVGAEALCRWHHPDRGDIPPSLFVPVAEETGAISAIGAWVLDTALSELAPLARTAPDDFTLSINLSPRQLDDADLVGLVSHAIAVHGWQPAQICLELTETAITDDLDLAFHALLAIRATGISIAVDDFGTGYSSLTHLQRLPIDAIKIDRSFVSGLDEHGGVDRSTIVSAVVGIASAMGLDSIAEGIETTAQLNALREIGCREGQGHLFSLAVPAATLIEMLDAPASAP